MSSTAAAAIAEGAQQMLIDGAASKLAAAASGSHASIAHKAVVVPPPPPMPSYLAPNPRNFEGYKLAPQTLTSRSIPLAHPVDMSTPSQKATAAGVQCPPPASYHRMQMQLRYKNALVVLRSEEASGAHAVYYVDHVGVWQVDPPTTTNASGSSHLVHKFETLEIGDGLSLVAVAPCFLLLTRAGGRLTIFHARPLAEQLRVLFDGTPLSPAPLTPHDAVVASAILSAKRDQLFVVLYEFYEERSTPLREQDDATKNELMTSSTGAVRTAGVIDEKSVHGSASKVGKQPLHKLTALQFNLRNLPSFVIGASHNDRTDASGDPSADLIHTFSSLQNYRLPRDDQPPEFENDANWHSPLACWLELPTASTHAPSVGPSEAVGAASTSTATPPSPPFVWFVVARVPYRNETESLVYEMQRLAQEKADESHRKLQPAEPPRVGENQTDEASTQPSFTSDKIVSDTHNLKNYSIDMDDDEEQNELGLGPGGTLNAHVDATIQLFDPLGNLLARRSFKAQPFLFAQNIEKSSTNSKASTIVGVKQGEELLLYGVHSAPQPSHEGLSLGAAGSVHTRETPMPVSRVGIVLKPVFSYAGLGYVQSGKQFKKYFTVDAAAQHILIAEHTKRIYVYSRPTARESTAAHHLLQLPVDDNASEENDRPIWGMQTVVMPLPTTTAVLSNDAVSTDPPVQGEPIVYVLTKAACLQYKLPVVPLLA